MLAIIGLVLLFFGVVLPVIEIWQDRTWPTGTGKGCFCLIILGILCLSL